ncbi:MAG: HAD family hydrolase [Micromonosporaceae bacterium]
MTGNGWQPRLVVLDLDGTTVGINQMVPSARVARAVQATIAAGVPVSVATGRPVWAALPTTEALGLSIAADTAQPGLPAAATATPGSLAEAGRTPALDEPEALSMVCSNGSVVYDVIAHRPVHQRFMDPGPALRALADARPDAGFAVEYGLQGYRYTASFPRDFPSVFLAQAELAELGAVPTTRLSGRVPGVPIPTAHTRCEVAASWIDAAALDTERYSYEIGYSGWVDVSAPGVSKASGVALLARDLGVAADEVLVIGDGGNDVSMFSWAGRSVAMGQAPPEVQAAADEVTASVEEDGVACVLEKWFG